MHLRERDGTGRMKNWSRVKEGGFEEDKFLLESPLVRESLIPGAAKKGSGRRTQGTVLWEGMVLVTLAGPWAVNSRETAKM